MVNKKVVTTLVVLIVLFVFVAGFFGINADDPAVRKAGLTFAGFGLLGLLTLLLGLRLKFIK